MSSTYAMIGCSREFWEEKRRALVAQDPVNTQHPGFTTTGDTYAHELHQDLIQYRAIEDFLEGATCYDTVQQRWTIPDAPTQAGGLLQGRARDREGGHLHPQYAWGYRACPPLVVRAAGPSFELPTPLDPKNISRQVLGFSNMATYFSVKMDPGSGGEKEDVEEMASYARQIFRDQPNRIHVRSLFFSGTHVRLFHFDRAGSQITPLIDIHKHPGTLVRLVTGLSSTNEHILGLDVSVQWTIVSGRKENGSVTTTGPCGATKTYPIVEEIPVVRDSIRGRGTTCWRVRDSESGEEFVVKNSWRPDDRSPEYELLDLAKGLPGVAQLVSYETGRGEISDFRCPTTVGRYQNRIATRVVTHSYGKPVYYFTSILQLLRAIRDAINGHRCLVSDGIRILHRDISHNNVLLGKGDATEGFQGVLIDLDMAFIGTDTNPKVTAQESIGTRMFQSLSVLESAYHKSRSPAHDYLDELESFLYLLTYIFLAYKPDGTHLPSADEGPSLVFGWGDDNANAAHAKKRVLFGAGPTAERSLQLVEEGWGPVCGTLFEEFRWWIYEKSCEKGELLHGGRAAERVSEPLKSLHSHRDEHYDEVLNIFDDAIQAIQAPVTAPSSTRTDSVGSSTPVQPSENTDEPVHTAPLLTCDLIPSFPPPGPPLPTQPRRSARIRDLRLAESTPPLPIIKGRTRTTKQQPPAPLHPDQAQPRRSARIQKRRREEDELATSRPSKVRRMKQGPRGTGRAR